MTPDLSHTVNPTELLENMRVLKRLAQRLVHDEAEAHDVAQAALEAAKNAPDGTRSFMGYAAGAVRFQALKTRRAAASRRRHEETRAQERTGEVERPDEIVERRDLMAFVLSEIGRLPDKQARAITLRYVEQLSDDEIAEREGISPSTVRSQVSRGIAELRTRLDARSGSRAAWSSVLAPWTLDSAEVAGAASDTAQANASATAAASTSSAALAGAFWTMTSVKLALTLSVGLAAAAGAWHVLKDGEPAPFDPGSSAKVAAASRDAGPADANQGGADPNAPLTGAATTPGGGRQSAGVSADLATTPATFPVTGRVIDAATGQPAEGVYALVRSVKENPTASIPRALTGADGVFESTGSLAACTLTLDLFDEESHGAGFAKFTDVAFPFDGDLKIELRPKVQFRFGGVEIDAADQVRVSVKGERRLRTRVRPGDLPWARFDEELPEDSRTLRMTHSNGFHSAVAQLPPAGPGRFDQPLDATWIAGGRFELATGDDRLRGAEAVRLRSLDRPSEPTQRLGFYPDRETKTLLAEATHLVPGRYAWTVRLGGVEQSGEVEVRPLETAQARLEDLAAAGPALRVSIDTTAAPGLDLEGHRFQFLDRTDPRSHFLVEAKRAGQGLWSAEIDDLPKADWVFVPSDLEGYRFEPQFIPITPGELPATLVVTPEAASLTPSITILDASNAQPIEGARLWLQDGMSGAPYQVARTGTLEAFELPGDRDVSLFAWAEGYRLTQLDVSPAGVGAELTLKLEPGWRHRVLVFDMQATTFAEGITVHVDGALVGRTDASGALWLEGEGPPNSVAIGQGDDAIEVLMDPFAEGAASGMETPGYVFVIARK